MFQFHVPIEGPFSRNLSSSLKPLSVWRISTPMRSSARNYILGLKKRAEIIGSSGAMKIPWIWIRSRSDPTDPSRGSPLHSDRRSLSLLPHRAFVFYSVIQCRFSVIALWNGTPNASPPTSSALCTLFPNALSTLVLRFPCTSALPASPPSVHCLNPCCSWIPLLWNALSRVFFLQIPSRLLSIYILTYSVCHRYPSRPLYDPYTLPSL